jgi:tol-pal system protein YbgF
MTARPRTMAGAAWGLLLLGTLVVGSACLSPGQARGIAIQVQEIRRQVDQVRLQQERTTSAFRALGPPPSGPPVDVTPAVSAPPVPTGEALYRSGYSLYHQGDYVGAETAFRAFLTSPSGSGQAHAARYWIGECLRARGLYREAIVEYRNVVDRDGTGRWAPRALYKIALSQEALGEPLLAQGTLRSLLHSFPESDVAPLARDRLKIKEDPVGRPSAPRGP